MLRERDREREREREREGEAKRREDEETGEKTKEQREETRHVILSIQQPKPAYLLMYFLLAGLLVLTIIPQRNRTKPSPI